MYYSLFVELGIDRETARLVEAWLRLRYGVLDALGREQIQEEYTTWIAEIIKRYPDESRALAATYGL